MNPGKLHKFMVFMTNAAVNMGTLMSGNASPNYSIISPLLQLSRTSSSVFTEDYHLRFKLWTTSGPWKGFKKFHMKDPCVIYFGPTLTTDRDGAWTPEEQAIPLDRILLNSSTMRITWRWSRGLTNSWWKGIPQLTTRTCQQFFQPRTIATGVVTKQQ